MKSPYILLTLAGLLLPIHAQTANSPSLWERNEAARRRFAEGEAEDQRKKLFEETERARRESNAQRQKLIEEAERSRRESCYERERAQREIDRNRHYEYRPNWNR